MANLPGMTRCSGIYQRICGHLKHLAGASGSLSYIDIESALTNSRTSQYRIAVANNSKMRGSKDGKLKMHVLNTPGYKGINTTTPFQINTTTAKELRTELFSLDGPFREGRWNILY